MGTALLKIKLMPNSVEVDFEEIKAKAKAIVEKGEGKRCTFEEEAIAFGLKALIVSFDIDEEINLEPIEEGLGKIENINSAQVIDMRRAFG
ncbi:elongation factor 1-beta [Candidatus Pacearchaeota archaeon]|nr:elongation factor 1-beta [Candidatus Pacearchaeota archaeon]